MQGDNFLVGGHGVAFLKGNLLIAEQQFRRPRLERRWAVIENIAENDLRQLVEEKRRDRRPGLVRRGRRNKETLIGAFQIGRGQQAVAEGQGDVIVLAGIGIGQRRQFDRRHRAARRGHQRAMQRPLGVAGLSDRRNLGPQQIGAQEIVADRKASLVVLGQQVKARVFPKILRPIFLAFAHAAGRSPAGFFRPGSAAGQAIGG